MYNATAAIATTITTPATIQPARAKTSDLVSASTILGISPGFALQTQIKTAEAIMIRGDFSIRASQIDFFTVREFETFSGILQGISLPLNASE
jgi:hypothetical protein